LEDPNTNVKTWEVSPLLPRQSLTVRRHD
jgi:hypothetical protein